MISEVLAKVEEECTNHSSDPLPELTVRGDYAVLIS